MNSNTSPSRSVRQALAALVSLSSLAGPAISNAEASPAPAAQTLEQRVEAARKQAAIDASGTTAQPDSGTELWWHNWGNWHNGWHNGGWRNWRN